MKDEYYDFIKVFVEKLIDSTYEKDNNIVVVKHYNTFEITENDIGKLAKEYGKDKYMVFYRKFQGEEMPDACDPFLYLIQQLYQTYYSEQSIEQFLDSFGVYSLQKSVFKTYIETSLCVRNEDLILSEVEQEREILLQTIVRMLLKISWEHPVLLCINGLDRAPKATIEILNRLLDSQGNGRFLVVAAYNDLRNVLPPVTGVWEQYMKRLESKNSIIDASLFRIPLVHENSGIFRLHVDEIDDYIIRLKNMFQTFDYEQAAYYLGIIYKKLELERLSINDMDRFEIIEIYAKISIYSEDIVNALLLCNSLNEICKRHTSFRMHYDYNYLLGLTQVYNTKLHMARKCADSCYLLAKENGQEFLMFKANMLKHMASMSGWHNILFCANDIAVDWEILQNAKKYEYYNHLAHTYIYAFDNEVDWFAPIQEIEQKVSRFQQGMEIARQIGNEDLMIVGYRKNIMLSSISGAFETTTYYYEKLYELVGDSDPVKAAEIYKGIGYNLCAIEKYKEANAYYNKALGIYYKLGMMEFVGETLYNMSLNCILGRNFQTAYEYLQMCIRIVNNLHLNNLRVCNISKLFGLLALCSYRLGLYYNCQMYCDNTILFLSHKLNSSENEPENIDPSYTVCDDDLFLCYYATALLEMQKGNLEQAAEALDSAEIYVQRSCGYQFFSYVQYYMTRAELYRKLGEGTKALEELDIAYEYAQRANAHEKMEMIQAAREEREWNLRQYDLTLSKVSMEEIGRAAEQAGINKDYREIKKQINFFGVWQKIVDITGKEKEELVSNALNSFALNFGMDIMVYVSYTDEMPNICFSNTKSTLTEEKLDRLTQYFTKHRTGFVASKMRKDYREYEKVLSVFGLNEVCSMIAVPFYVDEQLNHLFICYITMKDNWNSPINKYMLDENDFTVYSLVLGQLVNAISMLDKQQKINEINVQLENAAVTDYLTSLWNRDGFFANIHKRVTEARKKNKKLDLTVLYIDLDNFKYYNDTFGHDVGDFILKEVSKILMEQAEKEGFASRFGGDEFLIILEHADRERAMKKAREVLETILNKNAFEKEIKAFLGRDDIVIPEEKKVSCSIGVAPVSEVRDEEDISKAIKRADEALYGIKHSTKCDCKLAEEPKE